MYFCNDPVLFISLNPKHVCETPGITMYYSDHMVGYTLLFKRTLTSLYMFFQTANTTYIKYNLSRP